MGGSNMAVLKIKSVPQKYTDELAYQQLLDYIMRPDKTPDHYIGGFAVHPQYAAEEMQLVSQAYHQNRGCSSFIAFNGIFKIY